MSSISQEKIISEKKDNPTQNKSDKEVDVKEMTEYYENMKKLRKENSNKFKKIDESKRYPMFYYCL